MDIDDATTRIVEPRVGRILWEGRLSIVPPQGVQVVFDSVEANLPVLDEHTLSAIVSVTGLPDGACIDEASSIHVMDESHVRVTEQDPVCSSRLEGVCELG